MTNTKAVFILFRAFFFTQCKPFKKNETVWFVSERPRLKGSGDWTHQYGNAQNTSCSDDELVKGAMGVKWWGEPGPRPMPDRGPRNPAPLSAGGKLYIQGDRVLFGLDAYNGTVLWSQSCPEMRRANIPRDSSNMVADDRGLYLAQGRYCINFVGSTGQRSNVYSVPDADTGDYNWSFLAVVEQTLVGSRVSRGTVYLGDDGEWYENFKPNDINASVGIHSLKLSNQNKKILIENYKYYKKNLKNNKIKLLDFNNLNKEFPLYIEALTANRNKLFKFLKKKKIGYSFSTRSLSLSPHIKLNKIFKNAEEIDKKLLRLPSGPGYNKRDLSKIIKFLNKY